MQEGFGMFFECKKCDEDRIDMIGYIYNLLNRLPRLLGSKKMIQPYVMRNLPNIRGVIGTVEGNLCMISIMTYTEEKRLVGLVYSRYSKNYNEILAEFRKSFNVQKDDITHRLF